MVIDDPRTTNEPFSDADREKSREWYQKTYASRLNEEDLPGTLKPGDWEHLNLPFEPLKATSNVIELKPGRTYMLCFNRFLSRDEIAHLQQLIKAYGIQSIIVGCDADVEVIELPETITERE